MAMSSERRDEFFEICQRKLEKVRLTVVGREDISFPSKLHSINVHDDAILLTLKQVQEEELPIEKGSKLSFQGGLNNGQQVVCELTVRSVHISENHQKPSLVRVSWPDEFERKQMRQDVRIKTALKVFYTEELSAYGRMDPEKQFTGVISDISKGGAFILTREKVLYKGQTLYLYLYIVDSKVDINSLIPCRVVLVKSVGQGKNTRCHGMAVNFLKLSRSTEANLINWIYEQQRLMLAERVAIQKAEEDEDVSEAGDEEGMIE